MGNCTLTNEELADALNKWADRLADTGGKAWSMRVPVDPNFDPDMLMSEAARRLRSLPELPAVETEERDCDSCADIAGFDVDALMSPVEPETCENSACPRCGSSSQVWENQNIGGMRCHRYGCQLQHVHTKQKKCNCPEAHDVWGTCSYCGGIVSTKPGRE